MIDIVQELRGIQTTCPTLHSTFNSAANEIERLRFVIKTLRFEAEGQPREEPKATLNADGTTTWTDNAGSETR